MPEGRFALQEDMPHLVAPVLLRRSMWPHDGRATLPALWNRQQSIISHENFREHQRLHGGSGFPHSPAFPAKADGGNVENGAPCGRGPVTLLSERLRVINSFKLVASAGVISHVSLLSLSHKW